MKRIMKPLTGLLQFSESAFPVFLLEKSIYSSIFFIKRILFSSTEAKKTHQIPAWLKKILKFDEPECLQNTLISHYLNDLLHHGWRKFWNLMTWMPPKHFNFTLFEWSCSSRLKNILKFDDLNTSKTL